MDKGKVLEEIGLKKPEIKIYLALLELNESSISKIVNKTNMQKSAVYFYLKNLIDLGLISYIIKNNVKYFSAVHPKKFIEILDERKKDFMNLLPKLEEKIEKKEKETEIKLYEGYNGLKSVMEEQAEFFKKSKVVYVINLSNIQPLEKYQILWHKFEMKRIKERVEMKIITNVRFRQLIKEEYKKYKLREDRFLNKETPSAITISKNCVSILKFKSEINKPFVIFIKDKELAESFKIYFQLLWKQAKA